MMRSICFEVSYIFAKLRELSILVIFTVGLEIAVCKYARCNFVFCRKIWAYLS